MHFFTQNCLVKYDGIQEGIDYDLYQWTIIQTGPMVERTHRLDSVGATFYTIQKGFNEVRKGVKRMLSIRTPIII